MKVSLIIVNFNGSNHLQKLFKSISDLDYPQNDLEVFFFDNGSTDDSVKSAKIFYPCVKIIQNDKNSGFAAPHRIVAQKAEGEVLAFLNNDMRVDPGWIKEGLSYLNPEQGEVCASSKIYAWNGKSLDFNGGSLQYLGYADQYNNDKIKDGEHILFPCGGAMFIFRDVFLEAGCFDDDYFAIFEDVDLGWRLWLMGYKVVMAGKSQVYHKGHATLDSRNDSKKRYLMHKNALVTIIKNYDDSNLKKVLPIAFTLALKRALLFMKVEKRDFYFWEERKKSGIDATSGIEGLLHLVVLDDVLNEFESIMKKRVAVQEKREVTDEKILELFGDPLRNIMCFKEYLYQESSMVNFFHLDELFKGQEEIKSRLDYGADSVRKELSKMRGEMVRLRLMDSRMGRTDQRLDSLVQRFVEKKRADGLFPAISKSLCYCVEKFKSKF
ncbi:glycosyltransferase family 2 protein [Desulfonatronovibrio magnus]|uniref:glycosyltransferase family 2 protein n=1 Tax=Desulfonatronovibrio magnus TaxID=698827 RepID=UPI0005EB066F|nr:glycosyltransferase family 2 protein [Desulfonatronovibrio magnus]